MRDPGGYEAAFAALSARVSLQGLPELRRLLDRPEILPGESGLVQLRLQQPVVVAPGDRFVLRLLSPIVTLGGGAILEESRYRLKRFRDFVHWWAEWYRLRGQVETWIKDALAGMGIPQDSLPDKLYF